MYIVLVYVLACNFISELNSIFPIILPYLRYQHSVNKLELTPQEFENNAYKE